MQIALQIIVFRRIVSCVLKDVKDYFQIWHFSFVIKLYSCIVEDKQKVCTDFPHRLRKRALILRSALRSYRSSQNVAISWEAAIQWDSRMEDTDEMPAVRGST
jgi:hypothetical protein